MEKKKLPMNDGEYNDEEFDTYLTELLDRGEISFPITEEAIEAFEAVTPADEISPELWTKLKDTVERALANRAARGHPEFLEPTPVSFGQYLLSMRKQKGLTIREVAKQVGVSTRLIEEIESEVVGLMQLPNALKPPKAASLCQVLNLSLNTIRTLGSHIDDVSTLPKTESVLTRIDRSDLSAEEISNLLSSLQSKDSESVQKRWAQYLLAIEKELKRVQ